MHCSGLPHLEQYDTLTAALKLAWQDKDAPVRYETLEKLLYLVSFVQCIYHSAGR